MNRSSEVLAEVGNGCVECYYSCSSFVYHALREANVCLAHSAMCRPCWPQAWTRLADEHANDTYRPVPTRMDMGIHPVASSWPSKQDLQSSSQHLYKPDQHGAVYTVEDDEGSSSAINSQGSSGSIELSAPTHQYSQQRRIPTKEELEDAMRSDVDDLDDDMQNPYEAKKASDSKKKPTSCKKKGRHSRDHDRRKGDAAAADTPAASAASHGHGEQKEAAGGKHAKSPHRDQRKPPASVPSPSTTSASASASPSSSGAQPSVGHPLESARVTGNSKGKAAWNGKQGATLAGDTRTQ